MIVCISMAHLINFLATFSLLLVSALFFGPWYALTRSLRRFNSQEFVKITKTLAANLGPTMRLLLPGCILLMLAAASMYQPASKLYFSLPAIVLVIASLIITVAIEVPIVKEVEQWTQENLPADWTIKRDRWLQFHIYRVLSGLLACALWLAIFI